MQQVVIASLQSVAEVLSRQAVGLCDTELLRIMMHCEECQIAPQCRKLWDCGSLKTRAGCQASQQLL